MENKKPEGEVDLISLFEYIKSNLKDLFKGIGSLLNWLLKLVLDLLGIFVRWKYLILILSMLGGVFGFIRKPVFGSVYTYSYTLRTNYDSQIELYDQVNRMNQLHEDLFSIEIVPLATKKAIIANYFETANGNEQDSVFFNNFELTTFGRELNPKDFKTHRILFELKNKISLKPYIDTIVSNVEAVPSLINERDANVNATKDYMKSVENELKKIDTLLLAQSQRKIEGQSISDIIVTGEQNKEHLESKLLEASNERIIALRDGEIRLAKAKNILEKMAGPTLVNNKGFNRIGSMGLVGIGFILGLGLSLLLELFFFLQKRNRTT